MAILNDKSSVMVILNKENLLKNDLEIKLVKKANELAINKEMKVVAFIIGNHIDENLKNEVSSYCDELLIYENDEKKLINKYMYSDILKEFINKNKPRFLLMNNNDFGKVISSRIAGYFNSSVLTNCENIDINSEGNLITVKNINNNNIEFEHRNKEISIATINVKKLKINNKIENKNANVNREKIDNSIFEKALNIIEYSRFEEKMSIDKAEILVVAGKGVKKEEDLDMVRNFAKVIGGEVAFTRPLVQMGWGEHINQVGISGTTVKPKLMITVGVSGAMQFTDAMNKSEYIISINTDSKAPIFKLANCGLIGDLYEIIPRLLDRIN